MSEDDKGGSKKGKYFEVQTAAILREDGRAGDEDLPAAVAFEVEPAAINSTKGEMQEPAYRDKWFGVAFLLHFVVIIAVCILYATGTLETDWSAGDDSTNESNSTGGGNRRWLNATSNGNYYYNDAEESTIDDDEFSDADAVKFFSTFLLTVLITPILSVLMMTFMKTNAVALIQSSLYFAVGFNIILALWLLIAADGGIAAGIGPAFLALLLAWYAKIVWHRIPFAAANLRTAITAVQANIGMAFLALANIPLVTLWFGIWGYTFQCVLHSPWMQSQDTKVEVTDDAVGFQNQHEDDSFSTQGSIVIFALMLSFYWTLQVFRNVIHTTLAGTVGTWWFLPREANSCCSSGLTDSLSRSLTYSFGSICLGSLIVAIIETIRSMVRSSARNRNSSVSRCIAECLLVWIERIAEYFNKWAFVYVGLYGYSYVQAGKNVIALFRQRGWTTIISDSLVNRMLGMMCFCIGLINATIAALLTWMERSGAATIGLSALFALIVGILLSSLVFGVLVSAVDSIVVLYAEAPNELKENHPQLAQEMEVTWTQAWPDVFTPVGASSAASTAPATATALRAVV